MKKIFKLFPFIICFVLLLANISFAKEPPQVTAAFSSRSAQVGEEIQLKITVSGEFGNVPRPRLPQFDGFQWYYMQQSSRVEYSSALKSYNKVVQFVFVFIPQKPGVFDVGPFDIRVENKVYQHPPIEITVQGQIHPDALKKMQSQSQGGAAASAVQSSQQPLSTAQGPAGPSLRGADKNIFLKAWTDKNEVFPGEQITLTYSLFTRVDTRYEGFQEEPNTKGFWMEEVSMKKGVQQKTVNINGQRFLQADVRKIALFGTQTGEFIIKPGTIKASVRRKNTELQSDYFGSFFEDQFFGAQMVSKRENRLLGADDIPITVKPFPEANKPSEFNNMVGSYVLDAKIDKKNVKVNQPIKVEVTVQGKGNIDTITQPLFERNEHFRIIEGETETKKIAGDTLIGWRKFTFLFVPKKMGSFTIGPFRTVFFDPFNEKYASAESKAFKVTIAKGDYEEEDLSEYLTTPAYQDTKKKVTKVGSGMHFIAEELSSQSGAQTIIRVKRILKITDALLFVLLIVTVFVRLRSESLNKNIGLKRSKFALRNYNADRKRLIKRTRSKKTEELAEVYSEIARITMNYFSDKFNLANYSLTYQQIEEQFDAFNVTEDLRKQVQELFDTCDFARFAPSSISQVACMDTLNKSNEIIAQFEKMKVQNNAQ